MDVPGKFEVSALGPAMELNRVLLPLLGWPMKMTVGTSGRLMREFHEDLLSDAPAEGDRRVRRAVADEQRPAEDGPPIEFDEVVLVEAHGHEAASDPFAAGQVDDTQGRVVRGFEEVHGLVSNPV
jgi:hypothetical protein